jgi:hypothetical protein
MSLLDHIPQGNQLGVKVRVHAVVGEQVQDQLQVFAVNFKFHSGTPQAARKVQRWNAGLVSARILAMQIAMSLQAASRPWEYGVSAAGGRWPLITAAIAIKSFLLIAIVFSLFG